MSKEKAAQKRVDVVIIGAGPATLGLICNAMKTNRYVLILIKTILIEFFSIFLMKT